MAGFATLADTTAPVRVVLVGAGGMGKAWMDTLTASADVELAGLVDLDLALANAALAERGLRGVTVGASVSEVAAASGAQAVINVTVPGPIIRSTPRRCSPACPCCARNRSPRPSPSRSRRRRQRRRAVSC